jgi:Tol biopolymer transport system component
MRALPCSVTLLSVCGLALACGRDATEPVAGALELTISTTGGDLDPDGYTVTVDAGSPVAVPTNGTLSIPDLSAGQHTVTLAGLASNCVLGTPGPLEVTLSGPEGASARFEVACSSAYTLAYQGPAGVELTDAAGTVHRTLVPDATPLAWSPDGRLLAIALRQAALPALNDTLWLINPDSGGLRGLTPVSPLMLGFRTAKWAPDGRDLLYEEFGGPNSFPIGLSRIALDGSFGPAGLYVVSGESECSSWMQWGTAPDWSPDGSQIVVHGPSHSILGLEDQEVYILNRDGTDRRFLVKGQQPDWSPDGRAIVFVAGPSSCGDGLRIGSASLHLISPDGSNDRPLTVPAQQETDENPAWSPDGSKVAFVRLGVAPDSIVTSVLAYVIDADGTNEHQLVALPRHEGNFVEGFAVMCLPSWSADGLHLAFAGAAGTYVVNADGSDFHMVTDTPTCCVPAQWRR